MKAQSQICFLLFLSLFSFGQKVEETNHSGYKHNYVVSKLQFVEDARDTSRLKYIAEVRFSDVQTNVLVVGAWLDVIKIRAKSLGANSYLVHNFFEDDHSVVLTLRFYFAGENLLKVNKLKQDTNRVFVFNQVRLNGDSGSFYYDRKEMKFDSQKYFSIALRIGESHYMSTNKSEVTATEIYFKRTRRSRFFIVPANKNTFVLNRNKLNPISVGLIIYGIPVNAGSNKPYELSYELGRLLAEVYK